MPHTPGPWKFRPETNAIVGAKHLVGKSGNYVYETIGHLSESPFITLDERFSNARLIAAAPELLAALQAIADAESAGSAYPGDGWRLAHEKLCGYARAAIAKIKG